MCLSTLQLCLCHTTYSNKSLHLETGTPEAKPKCRHKNCSICREFKHFSTILQVYKNYDCHKMFDQYSLAYTHWAFLMISSKHRDHVEAYMQYRPPQSRVKDRRPFRDELWLIHHELQSWMSDAVQLAVGGWEYWLADDYHQLTLQTFTHSVPLGLKMVKKTE
jgi:hypothetical protein